MDLQGIRGSSTETWPTSRDANEISVKVEDISKVESVLHFRKEDDDVKLRFPAIKTEYEVSE
jgi:hypothetical protein